MLTAIQNIMDVDQKAQLDAYANDKVINERALLELPLNRLAVQDFLFKLKDRLSRDNVSAK